MMSGDRRGAPARRGGMTVLGRIPTVPKPVNLPSQRLENRGLDPNVELVPRNSVSWGGTAGRSPPTISSAWGAGTQASSPPLTNGTWGVTPKQGSGVSSSSVAWGGGSRPSSAGSRPNSAGSIGQLPDSQSTSNAWGPPPLPSRPLSASATSRTLGAGVQGQGQIQGQIHGQLHLQPPLSRPRSAETRPAQGSRLGDSATFPNNSPGPVWGGSATDSKLARDSHQPTAFQLTRVDFPTLGSEKSPDLRPQQGTANVDRAGDEKALPPHHRMPPNLPGSFEDMPRAPGALFGNQERPVPDTWRREPPFGGMPAVDGNWHRDEHRHIVSHDGHPPVVDSWRRETGHEVSSGTSPSDDNWRRGGPLVGPHGPHGPGRFAHEMPGFPPQQRYGPGPVPYGRGGTGGYGHHGADAYGNAGLLPRQGVTGRPGPLGPGMYPGPGPVPYEGGYGGPPGPMEDRGMMMMPGMYVGFPNRQGPPPEPFHRYPHGSMGSGPRLPGSNSRNMRERTDISGLEGDSQETGSQKDGRPSDSLGNRRQGGSPFESLRPGQGISGGQQHGPGPRDWGASASEEPMDFSKPVFGEDVSLKVIQSEKTAVPASTIDNEVEKDAASKGNGAVWDGSRSDDIKPRECNEEHVTLKETVGGKLSGRSSRTTGNQQVNSWPVGEVTPDISWAQRQGEEVVKEGGFSKEAESEFLNGKNHSFMKAVASVEKATLDGNGPRKDGPFLSTSKDRPVGRDFLSTSQRSQSAKQDEKSTSAAAGSGILRPGHQVGTGRGASSGNLHVAALAPETGSAFLQEMNSVSRATPPVDSENAATEEKPKLLKRSSTGAPSSLDATPGFDAAPKDHATKEDAVHKLKVVHDVEKEWRPKAASAEGKGESPPPVTLIPKTSPVLAPSASEPASVSGTDKGEAKSEMIMAEGYDFGAQRARMREIAHQRSLQLLKEEEERSNEQKAKALAKLEELNRRSAGMSASDSNAIENLPKDLVEGEGRRESDSSGLLSQESQNLNEAGRGSNIPGAGRTGKNEHGKRERGGDRKGSGRNREEQRTADSRDLAKSRVPGHNLHQNRLEPPLLPSPSETTSSMQSQPSSGVTQRVSSQDVRPLGNRVGFQPTQSGSKQNGRQRGRQVLAQQKSSGKQLEAGEEVEELSSFHEAQTAAVDKHDGGGWSSGIISGESILADPSLVPASSTATRKKRNSRNAKSKHKTDGVDGSAQLVLSSEHSDAGELPDAGKPLVSSHDVGGSEGSRVVFSQEALKDLPFQAVGIEFGDVDLNKDIFGLQNVSPCANGDPNGRRTQRKPQSKRPARDRGVQDVRVGDKAHSSEGLIWAPVRSVANTSAMEPKVTGDDTGFWTGSTGKGDIPISTVQVSEGDLPKSVRPRHDGTPQVGQSSVSHKQSHQQLNELPARTRPVTGGVQQHAMATEMKVETDSKHVDSFSRTVRPHASWRQRGSGSEKGPAGKAKGIQYQQEPQSGLKDGPSHSQDSRAAAGKVSNHIHRREESSYAHVQGDEYTRVHESNKQENQVTYPTRVHGQGSEQSFVQRSVTSQQQGKHVPPLKFGSGLVQKDQQLLVAMGEGNLSSSLSRQLSVSDDREPQTVTAVPPVQPSGIADKAHGTHESESQSEHIRQPRSSTTHGERRSGSGLQARLTGNPVQKSPLLPDREPQIARAMPQQSRPSSGRSRGYSTAPEVEGFHGEQPSAFAEQAPREREKTFRERDHQHGKVNPPTHHSSRPGGHGAHSFLPVGEEGSMGLNASSQFGRQQQGLSSSHEREHGSHASHQQFKPSQNFRHQGPAHDKDQQPRESGSQHQRPASGQDHWQQTSQDKAQLQFVETRHLIQGSSAGRKSLNSSGEMEHPMENLKAQKQSSQMGNDHHGSRPQPVSQAVGHQRASQDRRQTLTGSGAQKPHNMDSNSQWIGETGGGQFTRNRDHGQSRRGRVVSRGGGTGGGKAGSDCETKVEQPGPKRLVIDATGGAVPNLVAG